MTDTPHHHGNLRAALIAAGYDILCEGKVLTLRQAALRAGVSHAAPAHHFDGLAGLMTAIATRAFATFSAAMIAARDASPPDPLGQLRGICRGYLRFAANQSGLFQLMFAAGDVKRDDPELAAAAADAYGILRSACAPFAEVAQSGEDLELAVWSLVHGYAVLWAATDQSRPRPFQSDPDFDRILALLSPLVTNPPRKPLAPHAGLG